MKKKATLLIKNIHCIYTMREVDHKAFLYEHGFIAIHHDKILDLGTHEYSHLIDSDTRIIDGTNHIAVPSFIEVDAKMSCEESKGIREQHEFFMRYMQNGTLCINVNHPVQKDLLHDYHYEVMKKKLPSTTSFILHVLSYLNDAIPLKCKEFCISSSHDKVSLQSQMMAAQMLAMKDHTDAYELLKAITLYPAQYLNRSDLGILDIEKCANLLLLSVQDLHSFFYSLDQNKISQIIHKGVRIYPNLLI